MEDGLIVHREAMKIEGDRNLYNYTFHEATAQDRLVAIIETGEVGVIGAFLDQNPDLDLKSALSTATQVGNHEAAEELQRRITKSN